MPDLQYDIIEASPLGIGIIQGRTIRFANPALARLTGYSMDELTQISLEKLIAPSDLALVEEYEARRPLEKTSPCRYCLSLTTRSGALLKVVAFLTIVQIDQSPALCIQVSEFYPIDSEQTMDNLLEAFLWHSGSKYKEVLDSLEEVIFELDLRGNVLFSNSAGFKFFGVPEDEFITQINALDYINPPDRKRLTDNIGRLMAGQSVGVSEYMARKQDGSVFPVMIHSIPVFHDGKPFGIRGVIVDITERKQMEEKLLYLNQRDPLTGLYNRAYFENAMHKALETHSTSGLIICDVDGLKLINDTMGHRFGDQLIIHTAEALRQAFHHREILARIGGDEFAVLLPGASEAITRIFIRQLREAIERSNKSNPELPLSVSCGYAVGKNGSHPDYFFREADNNMYKEKLYHSQSNRSAIVHTLMKALEARDFITEGHADRLQDLVIQIAAGLGFPENRQNDLRLFSQFHDIGKVGIPDRILFKSGPLTPDEKQEMQRHSEIGYRIAQSSSDLAPISEWILRHHEWWNGTGYPLGLKGEDIPLECRILSIVDAFDAMTNDRPYRKAMPVEDALAELKKFAGIQFDPKLIKRFTRIIKEEHEAEAEA